jgi:hypothetical protein
MTSKQEIKALFIAELINTPEYIDVLNVKTLIISEIATPNIQQSVKYTFASPKNEEQLIVFNMCMLYEFGFASQSITSNYVVVDMSQFLQ